MLTRIPSGIIVVVIATLMITSKALPAHASGEDLTGSKWLVDGLIPYTFYRGKPGEKVTLGQFDPSGQDKEEKVEYEGTYDGTNLVVHNPELSLATTGSSDEIRARVTQDGRTITGTLHQTARRLHLDETNPFTMTRIGEPGQQSSSLSTSSSKPPPLGRTSGADQAPTLGPGGGRTVTSSPPARNTSPGPNPWAPLLFTGGAGLIGLIAGRTLGQLTSGGPPVGATDHDYRADICKTIRENLTRTIPDDVKRRQDEYNQRQRDRERALSALMRDRKKNYERLKVLGEDAAKIEDEINWFANEALIVAKTSEAAFTVGVVAAINKGKNFLSTWGLLSGYAGYAAPPAAMLAESSATVVALQVAVPAAEATTVAEAATGGGMVGGPWGAAIMAFVALVAVKLVETNLRDSAKQNVLYPATDGTKHSLEDKVAWLKTELKKYKTAYSRDMAAFKGLDDKLTKLRQEIIDDTNGTNRLLMDNWDRARNLIDDAAANNCGAVSLPFAYAPEVANTMDGASDVIWPDDLMRLRKGELPRPNDLTATDR